MVWGTAGWAATTASTPSTLSATTRRVSAAPSTHSSRKPPGESLTGSGTRHVHNMQNTRHRKQCQPRPLVQNCSLALHVITVNSILQPFVSATQLYLMHFPYAPYARFMTVFKSCMPPALLYLVTFVLRSGYPVLGCNSNFEESWLRRPKGKT